MKNKYIISGQIQLLTPLHIGSGYMSHDTDAVVMKDSIGNPIIPGSSLKGVIRTTAERLHYLIFEKSFDKKEVCYLGEDDCNRPNPSDLKTYSDLAGKMNEAKIEEWIDEKVCPICQLFGSNFRASKVMISDSTLTKESIKEEDKTFVRHSVSIDRETGAAKDGAKYDFEVVNKDLTFNFEMELENVTKDELKLILVVLNEMKNERIQLGGNIARGLGKVKLINDSVLEYDFSNMENQDIKKQFLLHLIYGEEYTKENLNERTIKEMLDKFYEAG